MSRGYQNDFSSLHGESMYDRSARERKAATMLRVLNHNLGDENTGHMSLLDVGASTGILGNFLSRTFNAVTGIDIDTRAIDHAVKNYAKQTLQFHAGDAMSLDFPAGSFDVVICSQVYEHVPDAQKMMDEIFRVLKPGGLLFCSRQSAFNNGTPLSIALFISHPSPTWPSLSKTDGQGKILL